MNSHSDLGLGIGLALCSLVGLWNLQLNSVDSQNVTNIHCVCEYVLPIDTFPSQLISAHCFEGVLWP